MIVTMRTHIGGYRDGLEWPPVGGQVDVPDHEADSLIANGYATRGAPAEEAVDAAEPHEATGPQSDPGAEDGSNEDTGADEAPADDVVADEDAGGPAAAPVKPARQKPASKSK